MSRRMYEAATVSVDIGRSSVSLVLKPRGSRRPHRPARSGVRCDHDEAAPRRRQERGVGNRKSGRRNTVGMPHNLGARVDAFSAGGIQEGKPARIGVSRSGKMEAIQTPACEGATQLVRYAALGGGQ